MTERTAHSNGAEPWKLELVVRGEGRSDGRTVAGVVGRTMGGAPCSPLPRPDGFWAWAGDGLDADALEQCLDALDVVRVVLCRRLAEVQERENPGCRVWSSVPGRGAGGAEYDALVWGDGA